MDLGRLETMGEQWGAPPRPTTSELGTALSPRGEPWGCHCSALVG